MTTLTIVGCGPGHPDFLTLAGARAIDEASCIVGSPRLIETFAPENGRTCPSRRQEALDFVDECLEKDNVCLLVSGDVGCFSLSAGFRQHLAPDRLTIIPGVSSVQLACARLGIDWAGAKILSVHGRQGPSVRELANEGTIIALLGGTGASQWLQHSFAALQASHQCWVCSQVGLPDEHIATYGGTLPAGALSIAVFTEHTS